MSVPAPERSDRVAPTLDRPIFIVGDGRSGTTLLRSLLSAHPRIAITPESHYMKRTEVEAGSAPDRPADFERFWARYTAWVRFRDLGVDPQRCMELIDQHEERTFRTVFVSVLAAYGERVGKPRVGEKTPGHIAYLSQLLDWFPDAHVLVLRRDPRAVVASKMHTPWVTEHIRRPSLRDGAIGPSRWHALVQQAEAWRRTYQVVLPDWQDDPRVRVVPYESLVQHPETELPAICDFLGEVFEAEMVQGDRHDVVPEPADETPDARLERWRRGHEERSNSQISADSMEKWRRELSPTEIAVVEAVCADGMREAGYISSTPTGRRVLGRVAAAAIPRGAKVEAATLGFARSVVRRCRTILEPPLRS